MFRQFQAEDASMHPAVSAIRVIAKPPQSADGTSPRST
jgi:hypothetical protein